MLTDGQLLQAYALNRDESAFTELVRRHIGVVYSVAWRRARGDAHLAKDITQLVFTALSQKARVLSSHPVPGAWLLRAVHFTATDLIRAEDRRRERERKANAMQILTDEGPAHDEWEAVRPQVDAVLGTLSERDRAAVFLRFFESQTLSHIGGVFGITEDAARMRIERALERMRSELARRGVTSSAALLSSILTTQAAVVPTSEVTAAISSAAMIHGAAATASSITLFAMTISKPTAIVTGALVLLTGLSTGGFVSEHHRAAQAEANLAEALAALTRANTTAANLKLRADGRQSDRASDSSRKATVPPPAPRVFNPPPPGAAPAAVVDSLGRIQGGNLLSMAYELAKRNPAMADIWLTAQNSALEIELAPLIRQLRLTPEQASRLKAIMSEKTEATADITIAANSQGLPLTDPNVKAMYAHATEKSEDALKTLLGTDNYRQLQRFDSTAPIRAWVATIAGDLSSTEPLTASQADELASMLMANTRPTADGFYALGTTNWDAFLSEASHTFSASQLAMIKAEHDQILLRGRLRLAAATAGHN